MDICTHETTVNHTSQTLHYRHSTVITPMVKSCEFYLHDDVTSAACSQSFRVGVESCLRSALCREVVHY